MEYESEEIVRFMRNTASYPDRPASVRVIETHISWLFLTDRYAYKLKKPVKFEFLDFSTVALREEACREELRLNRRFAPSVYVDVLPITQDNDGSFELGGRGNVVDWVVQMRRLPDDKAMDVMLRDGRLTNEHESAVSQYLSRFYAELPPEQVAPASYREAIERHVRNNDAALVSALPHARACIRRIHGLQLRYLNVERETFDNRAMAGRIVEGHGDLRPEYIYLESPPAVIDCIEFSQELRRVDIADELSFLDMECRRLENASFGDKLLAAYQHACRDEVPQRLLAFYRSYRACVRAKVAVFRDQQLAESGQHPVDSLVRQYLQMAELDASKLGAPCLLLVGGLSGTGKSTLARNIAEAFGAELLSTDSVRRALLGTSPSPASYGEGNYRPELRSRIYDELIARADRFLNEKHSVVLDGTFLSRKHRQRVYDLGARRGAAPLYVLCECNRQTAISRIQQRSHIGPNESETRVEFYDRQTREFDAPRENEPIVRVDTAHTMAQQLHAVYGELRRRLFA